MGAQVGALQWEVKVMMALRVLVYVLVAGFWLGVATTMVVLSLVAARASEDDPGEASFGFMLALAALAAAGYFLYLAWNP